MDERKLFEKWWNSHFSLGFREDDDKELRHKGLEYYDLETQMMWLAWQGRAAEGEQMRDAMQTVVDAWTSQFERNGHIAPEWVKKARAALVPNALGEQPAANELNKGN